MTVRLPRLKIISSGDAFSAAGVNAAVTRQKINIENVINGVQGVDALLWNNSTATLASDTLSLTGKPRVLVIDTEASGATDNLSTISNGTAYQQLFLKAANAGRVITVKHNVGNIKLWSGADVVLNSTNWLQLFYDGTQWSDVFIPPTLNTPAIAINTARTVLGSNAASVTISSIPATYQHLLLILEITSDAAASLADVLLRFNADATSANYYSQYKTGVSTAVTSAEEVATRSGIYLKAAAKGATFSTGNAQTIIFIGNYASSTMRRSLSYHSYVHGSDSSGNLFSASGGGDWTNAAAAINSITFLPQTGSNIVTGSAYTLYGLN